MTALMEPIDTFSVLSESYTSVQCMRLIKYCTQINQHTLLHSSYLLDKLCHRSMV